MNKLVYEEQCTNLNNRLDYLIHCTIFPVGVFKSFTPSVHPQVDHTTGRTLGWQTGPNCNLGARYKKYICPVDEHQFPMRLTHTVIEVESKVIQPQLWMWLMTFKSEWSTWWRMMAFGPSI